MATMGAAVLVIGTQSQAYASTSIYVSDWEPAGYGSFTADPDPARDTPGDSVMACDRAADGWGVQAELDINAVSPFSFDADRIATTRGESSPYCDIVTGNIAEETPVSLRVCLVKGTEKKCTVPKFGKA
ncbi:hypothetical protein [Streptomyces sp. NPDC003036]|uniref:hypothetical protein n=1 Tax=Streptomyces sp. NPDC003036 TaxID=3154442 RepID=UPI0033ABF3C9